MVNKDKLLRLRPTVGQTMQQVWYPVLYSAFAISQKMARLSLRLVRLPNDSQSTLTQPYQPISTNWANSANATDWTDSSRHNRLEPTSQRKLTGATSQRNRLSQSANATDWNHQLTQPTEPTQPTQPTEPPQLTQPTTPTINPARTTEQPAIIMEQVRTTSKTQVKTTGLDKCKVKTIQLIRRLLFHPNM